MFSKPTIDIITEQNRTNLKMCSWNIRGLTLEKLEQNILGNFFQEFDIISLSETWFLDDYEIQIPGFRMHASNRPHVNINAKRGSGGIAIYVKLELDKFVSHISNYKDNIVWCSLKKGIISDKPIALGSIYFPPEGSMFADEGLFEKFKKNA